MEDFLTRLQALRVTKKFLEDYYENTASDSIGSLLGDLELLESGEISDSELLNNWEICVDAILNEASLKRNESAYCYKCAGSGYLCYDINYCCKNMKQLLHDCRAPIRYNPTTREYVFFLRGVRCVQLLFHCPWCGKQLPKSLGSEFFETLEKEYGIKENLDIFKNPHLPEEFKSSVWWKKRGL